MAAVLLDWNFKVDISTPYIFPEKMKGHCVYVLRKLTHISVAILALISGNIQLYSYTHHIHIISTLNIF